MDFQRAELVDIRQHILTRIAVEDDMDDVGPNALASISSEARSRVEEAVGKIASA
jgi:hypothetical protein